MIATSEQFAEANPGVQIIWEKRSLQAFADRPFEEMADCYDLMVIDHPHVGAAAQNGQVLALDNQGFDSELKQLAKESCGYSHPSYLFDAKQWALAIDAAAPIAAYREDLLDNIPVSWTEVVRLSEQGRVIWPLAPVNTLMSFYNVLGSVGEPFGENGVGVQVTTGINVLNEMLSVTQHLPRQCFSMDPIGAYEWLACRSSHSYAPYLFGYSNYSRYGFRPNLVKVTNIPALGHDGPIGSPIGGTGISISSKTNHKDIALKYAFWLASAECQRGVFFHSGGQPANIAAWKDASCNQVANNFFKDTLTTLEKSYLRPRHNGYMAFQHTGSELIHACLTEQATVPATVAAINLEYDKSFEL